MNMESSILLMISTLEKRWNTLPNDIAENHEQEYLDLLQKLECAQNAIAPVNYALTRAGLLKI